MKPTGKSRAASLPHFIDEATKLNKYLRTLSDTELAKHMHISAKKAEETAEKIAAWSNSFSDQTPAIDTFVGDIYSGLQAPSFTRADREYAQKQLYILSGLYGFIRPLDGIMPYRLEMAYKFPAPEFNSLYTFWGAKIANKLPKNGPIINTSSVEYSKVITPFVDKERIITPQFFTVNEKTGKPTFVTVHSKIARGAFARWLITSRIKDGDSLEGFNLLGYRFNKALSLPGQPAYVANEFGGTGLSIRLHR